ncbi:MAG: hypothetical protein ACK51L_03835, partial [bacterium]
STCLQYVSPKEKMLFSMTSFRVDRKKSFGKSGGMSEAYLSNMPWKACKPVLVSMFTLQN